MVKRSFDFVLAALALLVWAIPMVCLAIAIKMTSPGSVLYWSDRVGQNNRMFRMPKFRTMRTDTPEVATHLLNKPADWTTPLGRFLRSTSLDELPQLWSILVGNMSFVGPRPALFNQDDLIEMRTVARIQGLRPGLTGWAQVNGRDELPIADKVRLDVQYFRRRSLWFDLKILLMTPLKVVRSEGILQPESPPKALEPASSRRAA